MALKIELPPTGVMRTIVVPSHMTLVDLHDAIQAVLNWEGMHLWSFSDGRDGPIYEVPSRDDDAFAGFGGRRIRLDASKVSLARAFPARGAKLTYEYDFGDNWDHRVTRMADPKTGEIACTKSAGPDGLEDYGGPWRFAAFIDAIKADPNDARWRESREEVDISDEKTAAMWLAGPSLEDLTARLRDALAHVTPPEEVLGTAVPMSEEEKGRMLGLLFATMVDCDTWYVLEDALEAGGSCSFDDSDGEVAAFLMTMFDGLRVTAGKGGPIFDPPRILTVPDEWSAWYPEFKDVWKDMRVPFDILEDYARAAVNLYGALSLRELHELVLHYDPGFTQTVEELERAVSARAQCPHMVFRLENDLLVNDDAYPDVGEGVEDQIAELRTAQTRCPRWYPETREDLFKWAFSDHYERVPQVDGLEFVLKTVFRITDEREIEEASLQISKMLQVGAPAEVVYEALVRSGAMEKVSSNPRQRFLDAIDRLGEVVHAYELNGNRRGEFKPKPIVSDRPAVGRNAPCPCGSGKKYKMCCGRIRSRGGRLW